VAAPASPGGNAGCCAEHLVKWAVGERKERDNGGERALKTDKWRNSEEKWV